MANLLFWDHVLGSFVLGFTPLALALGWKLISIVGNRMWYPYQHDLRVAEARRLHPFAQTVIDSRFDNCKATGDGDASHLVARKYLILRGHIGGQAPPTSCRVYFRR